MALAQSKSDCVDVSKQLELIITSVGTITSCGLRQPIDFCFQCKPMLSFPYLKRLLSVRRTLLKRVYCYQVVYNVTCWLAGCHAILLFFKARDSCKWKGGAGKGFSDQTSKQNELRSRLNDSQSEKGSKIEREREERQAHQEVQGPMQISFLFNIEQIFAWEKQYLPKTMLSHHLLSNEMGRTLVAVI